MKTIELTKVFAGKRVTRAFMVAIIILGAAGMLSILEARRSIGESGWVFHTEEVLAKLDGLEACVKSAESAERAFVLLDREEFETVFQEKQKEFAPRLAFLDSLTQDNPLQQERLVQIRSILDRKNEWMSRQLVVRRSAGLDSSIALMRTLTGSMMMDSLSTKIEEMKGEENRLLVSRTTDSESTARLMLLVETIVVPASVVLLAAIFLFLRGEVKRRTESERRVSTLNASLERHAVELEASNRELEAFSYSVSHDLRAPLRHIDGYVELLRSNKGSQIDEKGQNYLHVISSAARELGVLIDELLIFSRIGRTDLTTTKVDMRPLFEEVVAAHAPEMERRDVHVTIGDLPSITGDLSMMRLVATNLISNALKYTRPRSPAVIEVSHKVDERGADVFSVRDNGVGFDMLYVQKLFGVFQRLHGASEFEGTGIGLANVRRIVERHGGTVLAEGEVDKGAIFSFRIPRDIGMAS
jgi:signal transduction histidine kinase